MKPYYELQCSDVDQISHEVYEYLHSNTNLLDQTHDQEWHYLDRNSVIANCPTLLDFFKLYRLVPRDLAVTICYNDFAVHIDSPPVIAKINFPVLNTKNTVNRWYTMSDEDFQNLPKIPDVAKDGYYHEDMTNFPKERLTLMAEYHNMTNPIVFNSRIPHEVVMLGDNLTPRVVLSCTFANEPLRYLTE